MGGNLGAFYDLVLHRAESPDLSVRLWATLSDGCLTISGQDLGPAASMISGEDEYEYFYGFDEQNTTRLFALISEDDESIQPAILQCFGGENGEEKLRRFCKTNDIEYQFHSC